MPFNILSSIQSQANKYAPPPPTYNTFTNFVDKSGLAGFGANYPTQNLFGGIIGMLSQDGTKWVSSLNGTTYAFSTDGLTSVTKNSTTTNACQSACISSDGVCMYVVTIGNGATNFFYSTNSGVTWNSKLLSVGAGSGLRGVACNYGGTNPGKYVLVAGGNSTFVYYSSDYGANFSQIANSFWGVNLGAELSDDGLTAYITGAKSGSYSIVAKCTNIGSGNTWTELGQPTFSNNTCLDCAVSASGKYILVGRQLQTYISLSTDYGATWTNVNIASGANRTTISMSRDGKYMFACSNYITSGSNVYYSTNYGTSWTALTSGDWNSGVPPAINQAWVSACVSGDGKRALLGAANGTYRCYYSIEDNV